LRCRIERGGRGELGGGLTIGRGVEGRPQSGRRQSASSPARLPVLACAAAPAKQGGSAPGQRPRHSARGARAYFYGRGARPWEGRRWPGLLAVSAMDTGHGRGLGPEGEMGRAFGLGPDR
jgi:hypothetical protein